MSISNRELTCGICWLPGVLLAGLLGFALGCRPNDESARESISGFGELELTQRTSDSKLQEELARIQGSGGFPLQLQQRQPRAGSEGDLTALCQTAFPSTERILSIDRAFEAVWPESGLRFTDVGLEHARRLAEPHQRLREVVMSRILQDESGFCIAFDQGMSAPTLWLDTVGLVARLEAIELASSVHQGHPDDALESLADLTRLAEKLEGSASLVAHLKAVDVRRWVIEGIQMIANSSQATQATHRTLYEMVTRDREKEDDESLAWIGDRAMGLHTYEMVRAGEYLSLLSDDEIAALEERNEKMDKALVVRRNVDHDELFYLDTMRLLISGSSKPYHARRAEVDAWFESLDQRAEEPRYPAVAAELLLVGVSTAQQRLARGRARRDAWWLALAEATGNSPSEPVLNAETGVPFVVTREAERLEVSGLVEADVELQPVLTLRAE